jgi:hypothetical protein
MRDADLKLRDLPADTSSCAVLIGLPLPTISTCGSAVARASATTHRIDRRFTLQNRQQVRLCDKQDRVAVAWPRGGVLQRRGAGAADTIGDDKLSAEYAWRMDHHHACCDIRAAAGT